MLDKTLIELRTKYPLSIIGVGGSQQDKKEETITVSFLLNRSLNKDECRELLVDVVEALLKNINQNEDLQPYLYDVPFTYKNLKIIVFLRHPDRSDINYPDISVFSLRNGKVGYDIDDPKIRYRFSTDKEPYEKAQEIVKAQRSEKMMTPNPEPVCIPVPVSQPPEPTFFQKMSQKFYDFLK